MLFIIKDKENICLFGDFNVRVGYLFDFYIFDNYLMYVNDCEDIFLFDIVIWFLVFEKCSVVLERIV